MHLFDRLRGEMRLSPVEASGDGVFAVNTLLFIALHSYIVRI